jgi:hypothetical protein
MSNTVRQPSRVLPQSIPRLPNIGTATNGMPAPKHYSGPFSVGYMYLVRGSGDSPIMDRKKDAANSG